MVKHYKAPDEHALKEIDAMLAQVCYIVQVGYAGKKASHPDTFRVLGGKKTNVANDNKAEARRALNTISAFVNAGTMPDDENTKNTIEKLKRVIDGSISGND